MRLSVRYTSRMQPVARTALLRPLVGWLSFALMCSCACALRSTARAQPLGEVVVVPVGKDIKAAVQAASLVEAELSAQQVSLISSHDARDRFTARSRPPQTASDSDVDVLAREARDAIEHVAFGRTAAAQRSVREVISRAELTLESLNRETTTARQILDACLSLVRSTLQGGKREVALEQATRCRRLVPDLVPSAAAHPANVIGVLAEADSLLRRLRIGDLTVHSAPESSCSVYLNGRHLGTTPFHLDRAAAGDYRVQVECGSAPARVHLLQLGDQPAKLVVDTEFDRAVGSDPVLLLRYASADEARRQAASHGTRLAREVAADDAILVLVDDTRVQLLRVQAPQQRLVARATVNFTARTGVARPALERAVATLIEGRLESAISDTPAPAPGASPEIARHESVQPASGGTGSAPDPASQSQPRGDDHPAAAVAAPDDSAIASQAHARSPQRDRKRRISRTQRVVSGLAVAAGVGSLVYAGAAIAAQRRDGDRLRSIVPEAADYPVSLKSWEARRSPPYLYASLGSAVASAGVVGLLLSVPRESVPLWASLVSAAAGTGLAAWGVATLLGGDSCDDSEFDRSLCSRKLEQRDRGAFITIASAPLLAVPLTQALRYAVRGSASRAPALSVEPELSPRSFTLLARVRCF
jgi:hypothetical protein